MAGIIDAKGEYSLDFIMLPSEYIGEFNNFMEQHRDRSDYELFNEMVEIKGELSQDLLKQHVKNLDALSQMNGFVNDIAKQKITVVRDILTADMGAVDTEDTVDSEVFFGGTSLLLWFLILATIWRRPSRGFFGSPFFW